MDNSNWYTDDYYFCYQKSDDVKFIINCVICAYCDINGNVLKTMYRLHIQPIDVRNCTSFVHRARLYYAKNSGTCTKKAKGRV